MIDKFEEYGPYELREIIRMMAIDADVAKLLIHLLKRIERLEER